MPPAPTEDEAIIEAGDTALSAAIVAYKYPSTSTFFASNKKRVAMLLLSLKTLHVLFKLALGIRRELSLIQLEQTIWF